VLLRAVQSWVERRMRDLGVSEGRTVVVGAKNDLEQQRVRLPLL